VTGATGATGPAAANNGLTLAAGPTVQLGGALNQATNVTFGGASNFALSFGDNVGPGPSADLKLGNTAGISATQTANAQFGGSVSSPIRVVTANYTIGDDDYTVLCNNTAGVAPVTITPPAPAASNKGRFYIVKRVNPNVGGTTNSDCVVANVDGAVGNVVLKGPNPGLLTTNLSGVTIQSDGTQWWIVGAITGTIPPTAVQDVATNSIDVPQAVYTPDVNGPRVQAVVPASGQLIVILTGELSTNRNSSTAFMSVTLNNSVALDANSLRVTGQDPVRASITVLITNLTPGVTITFEAVYKLVGAGTATFNARQIIVIPN
jgi:hypothetical protein